MNEDEVSEYLRARGCPEYIWKSGTEGLVRCWNDFVNEVEKGYCPDCLMDEYWNDLDVRELIHDIGADEKVREGDKKLRTLLTATHMKHHKIDRHSDYDFWNYGYPKNASGFFYQQVKQHVLRETE